MKKYILLFSLSLMMCFGSLNGQNYSAISTSEYGHPSDSNAIDFNRGWQFAKSSAERPLDFLADKQEPESVITPHTWNADDMIEGINKKDQYLGTGWYVKTFGDPLLEEGQRLCIEFEGIALSSKIWVNQTYVGGKNDGYLGFRVDITDALVSGENTMYVRANNEYNVLQIIPFKTDWNKYGGIHRPVWAYIENETHIDYAGVELRQMRGEDVNGKISMDYTILTHVSENSIGGNEVLIRHRLFDDQKNQVGSVTEKHLNTRFGLDNQSFSGKLKMVDPVLWSDKHPYLYKLITEVLDAETNQVLDTEITMVGFRYFEFNKDQGFVLNGEKTWLLGVNEHIFYPGLGSAVNERYYQDEIRIMKEMGCNFLRTSHYPRPKYFMDLCDQHGILVIAEQPYWHGSIKSESGEVLITNIKYTISDFVRKTANHPSLVAYNTVNEIALAPKDDPGIGHLEPGDPRREAWLQQSTEWPYMRRACGAMIDEFHKYDNTRPVSLIIGGAWKLNLDAGLPQLADIVGYNGGANRQVGSDKLEHNGAKADWVPKVVKQLYPNSIHLGTEGMINHFKALRGDWEAQYEAWEQQANAWNGLYSYEWYAGIAMWCLSEYSSSGFNGKHGVVDKYRLPKETYHFYKAMWGEDPNIHIFGHWNWEEGALVDIPVFTNGENVELFLNGEPLLNGENKKDEWLNLPNPPTVWENVKFVPGTLRAVATVDGKKIEHRIVTHGEAASIELELSNNKINADGRDISYVTLTILDEEGIRCFLWNGEVKVQVEGAARRGGAETLKVTAGVARFALRNDGSAGRIGVTVSGPKLVVGKASLEAF